MCMLGCCMHKPRLPIKRPRRVVADDEEEIDEEGNLICRAVAFDDLSEREQKLLVLEDLLNKLNIEA